MSATLSTSVAAVALDALPRGRTAVLVAHRVSIACSSVSAGLALQPHGARTAVPPHPRSTDAELGRSQQPEDGHCELTDDHQIRTGLAGSSRPDGKHRPPDHPGEARNGKHYPQPPPQPRRDDAEDPVLNLVTTRGEGRRDRPEYMLLGGPRRAGAGPRVDVTTGRSDTVASN